MVIDKDLILLDLTGDKETIISTLAKKAFDQGRLENQQEYIDAVLKREKEYSTALGYEVAIPHGQSDTVKDPFVVNLLLPVLIQLFLVLQHLLAHF